MLKVPFDCTASIVKPAGGSAPTMALDSVTAYASAQAPMGTVPASAVVKVAADPDAALCEATACAVTASTPLQAEMRMPPLTTCDRSASTARMLSCEGALYPSGKPCAFVATYVAMEIPPALVKSTSRYVFPTRGKPGMVITSITESTMFGPVPSQNTVATIASPLWGLVFLNPLRKKFPVSASQRSP